VLVSLLKHRIELDVDTVDIDSIGDHTLALGLGWLLGFTIHPRIKRIKYAKLVRLSRDASLYDSGSYPRLVLVQRYVSSHAAVWIAGRAPHRLLRFSIGKKHSLYTYPASGIPSAARTSRATRKAVSSPDDAFRIRFFVSAKANRYFGSAKPIVPPAPACPNAHGLTTPPSVCVKQD
jgi:hypothetical protein